MKYKENEKYLKVPKSWSNVLCPAKCYREIKEV